MSKVNRKSKTASTSEAENVSLTEVIDAEVTTEKVEQLATVESENSGEAEDVEKEESSSDDDEEEEGKEEDEEEDKEEEAPVVEKKKVPTTPVTKEKQQPKGKAQPKTQPKEKAQPKGKSQPKAQPKGKAQPKEKPQPKENARILRTRPDKESSIVEPKVPARSFIIIAVKNIPAVKTKKNADYDLDTVYLSNSPIQAAKKAFTAFFGELEEEKSFSLILQETTNASSETEGKLFQYRGDRVKTEKENKSGETVVKYMSVIKSAPQTKKEPQTKKPKATTKTPAKTTVKPKTTAKTTSKPKATAKKTVEKKPVAKKPAAKKATPVKKTPGKKIVKK